MSTSTLLEILALWPEPNYVNPVTRGGGIIVTSALFGFLGTLATALRLYTRLSITRTFGLDDVFIIIAWVSRALEMAFQYSVARCCHQRR
jgi:hypothetical protein